MARDYSMPEDSVHVSVCAIPHNVFQVYNLQLVYIVVLNSLFDCSFKQSRDMEGFDAYDIQNMTGFRKLCTA